MANTVTISGSIVTITNDGTLADFNMATYFPGGVKLNGIKAFGSGNDIVQVREGGATGAIMCKMKDNGGFGMADKQFGGIISKPYIKASECSSTTMSALIIIFELC